MFNNVIPIFLCFKGRRGRKGMDGREGNPGPYGESGPAGQPGGLVYIFMLLPKNNWLFSSHLDWHWRYLFDCYSMTPANVVECLFVCFCLFVSSFNFITLFHFFRYFHLQLVILIAGEPQAKHRKDQLNES